MRNYLSIVPNEDSLKFERKGKKVGYVRDWLEGLKERNDFDLILPHGQWLELDKSFIESYLASKGLRIGYLVKTTYKNKKYSYDKVQSFDQYQLINVTPIIYPNDF